MWKETIKVNGKRVRVPILRADALWSTSFLCRVQNLTEVRLCLCAELLRNYCTLSVVWLIFVGYVTRVWTLTHPKNEGQKSGGKNIFNSVILIVQVSVIRGNFDPVLLELSIFFCISILANYHALSVVKDRATKSQSLWLEANPCYFIM